MTRKTTLFLRALVVLGVLAMLATAQAQTATLARPITVYQDPG